MAGALDLARGASIAALMSAALAAAPASASIVNISALDGLGTTVVLGPGTYTVGYAGVSGGGLYDAYSPWSYTSGCDGAGMNCQTGWLDGFAIDFGHGSAAFDRQDGYNYGLLPAPGDNRIYGTAAQALASYSSHVLDYAPLPQAGSIGAYSSVGGPVTFTLAGTQAVNFFILDNPYSDNRGGVSLTLTTPGGAPEPGAWGLMIAGFGLAGAMLRRERRALTSA